MQNGYIESFNGRMRDELPNESLFFDLDQARQVIGAWVRLQHGETAFVARIQDAGSLCRTSHRNRPSRCAIQRFRALAGCSHRAEGINSRGSNRYWMKVQWQVRRSPQYLRRPNRESSASAARQDSHAVLNCSLRQIFIADAKLSLWN
jgi:hypothetical protein